MLLAQRKFIVARQRDQQLVQQVEALEGRMPAAEEALVAERNGGKTPAALPAKKKGP